MTASRIDPALLEAIAARLPTLAAGVDTEGLGDEALFMRLVQDEHLRVQAPQLFRRCQIVLGSLQGRVMVSGDYAGLFREILHFGDSIKHPSPIRSGDGLMGEVAEQILAKAGTGMGEVTLKASDLAAWGNTLKRTLAARASQ